MHGAFFVGSRSMRHRGVWRGVAGRCAARSGDGERATARRTCRDAVEVSRPLPSEDPADPHGVRGVLAGDGRLRPRRSRRHRLRRPSRGDRVVEPGGRTVLGPPDACQSASSTRWSSATLTRDARPDVVLSGHSGNALIVLLGDGHGALRRARAATGAARGPGVGPRDTRTSTTTGTRTCWRRPSAGLTASRSTSCSATVPAGSRGWPGADPTVAWPIHGGGGGRLRRRRDRRRRGRRAGRHAAAHPAARRRRRGLQFDGRRLSLRRPGRRHRGGGLRSTTGVATSGWPTGSLGRRVCSSVTGAGASGRRGARARRSSTA